MASILFVEHAAQLAEIRRPGMLAVIQRAAPAPWSAELASAIESGAFSFSRRSLIVPRPEALVHELEYLLPHEGVSFVTRLALIDDLAELADCLSFIAACSALMLRLFTEAPTNHCGFHVDTTPPSRQPFGLLKVYNGEGTRYVAAEDVADMKTFDAYVGRRERLVRNCAHGELATLDDALPFVNGRSAVQEVPPGSTVAFRLLDVREYARPQLAVPAWIHCSPMAGVTRLVANFTPLDGPVRRQ
jgi:hypothetical protein